MRAMDIPAFQALMGPVPQGTARPEMWAQEPTKLGQIPVVSWVGKLRLQQMKDLAAAYGLEIPKDGTKTQVLPHLVQAEQEGVFHRDANNDSYLLRASRTSDDPPLPAAIQAGMTQEEWEKHVSNPKSPRAGRLSLKVPNADHDASQG